MKLAIFIVLALFLVSSCAQTQTIDKTTTTPKSKSEVATSTKTDTTKPASTSIQQQPITSKTGEKPKQETKNSYYTFGDKFERGNIVYELQEAQYYIVDRNPYHGEKPIRKDTPQNVKEELESILKEFVKMRYKCINSLECSAYKNEAYVKLKELEKSILEDYADYLYIDRIVFTWRECTKDGSETLLWWSSIPDLKVYTLNGTEITTFYPNPTFYPLSMDTMVACSTSKIDVSVEKFPDEGVLIGFPTKEDRDAGNVIGTFKVTVDMINPPSTIYS